MSGELDLGKVPTILSGKNSSLCLNYWHSIMVYAKYVFSSGSLKFCMYQAEGVCLCDQLPVKTLGTESLRSSLWSQHIAGGIKHNLCDSTGTGLLGAVPGFLQTWPLEPFPFADFALEPCSVINQSCEDNYMLSLLSLASKPLNLGVVLGTSGTIGMC